MPSSVAQLCHERQVSLEALVERSGLESARVTAIVEGRWTPSPQERRRIADALGAEVNDIAWGHATPVQHLWGHGPT